VGGSSESLGRYNPPGRVKCATSKGSKARPSSPRGIGSGSTAGRAAVEDAVPVVGLRTIISRMTRPLVVAVAHVPIVLVVLLAFPLWILLAVKPAELERLAVQVLVELRRWSAASVAGTETEGV
jgi:hypothetical protein